MKEQPLLSEIIKPAEVEALPELLEWVHQQVHRSGLPFKQAQQFEIALEEVIVNVILHAYPSDKGLITLKAVYYPQHKLEVTILDQGIPFNPLIAKKKEQKFQQEPPIGGLGIVFLQAFADRVQYERMGDSNLLLVTKEL